MNTRTLLLFCLLALPVFANTTTDVQTTDVTTEQAAPNVTRNIVPNAFITDNLYIFVHSGAGKNYRILGSVSAGTAVQVLGEASNGFVNILDDKGREGWVEATFVTTEPGLLLQNEKLRDELAALNLELQTSQSEIPALQAQIDEFEQQQNRLRETITELETQKVKLQQEALSKKEGQQHLMLTYGAGIAFGGLILGVMLTLFLSRRKRYDGWA